MKLGCILAGAAAAAVAVLGLVACNAVLGISQASLAADDAGTVPRGLTCAYYCQEILANCTGNSAEFILGDCPRMCNDLSFDLGDISQTSGDTLGCRIHYAELAATGNSVGNCRFAGALGGGQCGSQACEHFCAVDVGYCNSSAVNVPAYTSTQDCLGKCLPGDGGSGYAYVTDGGGGTAGVDLPSGTDTLNCRFYHLENAYPSPAAAQTHCPHTGVVSAVCN